MRVKLETQNIFFMSDAHWHHANVIKYDGRPFYSLGEMNEALISNWNNKVGKDDYVFYLGDLSFADPQKTKEIVDRLNGKIYYILGNHDKYRDIKGFNKFLDINDYCELRVRDEDARGKEQMIVLSHYPILEWNKQHRGAWHLHGHTHQSLRKRMDWYYEYKVIDVGCNGQNYTPLSYKEIKKIMETKKTGTHH